jgi:hypothetical protein
MTQYETLLKIAREYPREFGYFVRRLEEGMAKQEIIDMIHDLAPDPKTIDRFGQFFERLFNAIIAFVTSCTFSKPVHAQYEYFWYSHNHFIYKSQLIQMGVAMVNHSTVNGQEYTLLCSDKSYGTRYKKQWPDAQLVLKAKAENTHIRIHY